MACVSRFPLAEVDFAWEFASTYRLALEVRGDLLRASTDGKQIVELSDTDSPLTDSAIALVCDEGRTTTKTVTVEPLA